MRKSRWALPGIALAFVLIAGTNAGAMLNAGSGAGAGTAQVTPIVDDSLQALSTTIGGADVVPTAKTITHWNGTTLDAHNGVTYSYNMVGSNPNTCSGSACATTIQADITPINVNIDGLSFNGTDVVPATLASPQFAGNDYGSTPFATAGASNLPRGPGGTLSQGDAGQSLQLEDATMRAQFNRTGAANPYHLVLHPNVLPAVTINVPSNQGTLLQSGRGVIFPSIDIGWWSAQIQNLISQSDPTHLPIFLTNNVMLFEGKSPLNCCVIGFHGTKNKNTGSNGSETRTQTFAWASWVQPGLYSRANGGTDWALQDIHALSHEISEWADDPFVNNTVEPWLTPTAPQYGCSNLLETGDPVVAIGFAMGTNSFEQGTNPDGTQSADGYYHPEDEAFLPWFMRSAPNTISEATQSPSANIGRYTFMGDLNPFPGFRAPATGC